jgi:hypothetical protein
MPGPRSLNFFGEIRKFCEEQVELDPDTHEISGTGESSPRLPTVAPAFPPIPTVNMKGEPPKL